MSKFLIGLFSILIFLGSVNAASDAEKKTDGGSAKGVTPIDPVEKEYQKLLAEDDASQAEVDKWIIEAQRSNSVPSPTLTLRIRQRFDPVKKQYEEFLQRNPKHVQAHLAFGSFLQEMGEEAEGAKHWEKARELDPKDPAAWNNLANYFGHNSPVKKSFEYYAKAIELDPTEPVYYQNFATTVYLFRKDAMEYYGINETEVFDKALDLYRQAMKLAPDDFVLATDYAQSFYGTKPPRVKEGLEAWTEVLKIARDDIERQGVHIHLGRLNWKLGNFDEARKHLALVTNEMYATSKNRLVRNVDESEKGEKATDAAAPTDPAGNP